MRNKEILFLNTISIASTRENVPLYHGNRGEQTGGVWVGFQVAQLQKAYKTEKQKLRCRDFTSRDLHDHEWLWNDDSTRWTKSRDIEADSNLGWKFILESLKYNGLDLKTIHNLQLKNYKHNSFKLVCCLVNVKIEDEKLKVLIIYSPLKRDW